MEMIRDKNSITDKCKIISKSDSSQIFRSYQMHYVGKRTLTQYLSEKNKKKPDEFLSMCVRIHMYILESIKLLVEKFIVHFDIKGNNILYDDKQHVPIMIDFGMAYELPDKIKEPTQLDSLRIYSEGYRPWPIELIILKGIYKLHKEESDFFNREITSNEVLDLTSIIDRILTENELIKKILSSELKEKLKKEWLSELEQYVGKTWSQLINHLYKYWKTWDHYACAILFLSVLHDKDLLDEPKYKAYRDILYSICIVIPSKRLSIQKTMGKFRERILH